MLDAPLPMPFIITSSKSHQLKPQGNILGKVPPVYRYHLVFITKIKTIIFSVIGRPSAGGLCFPEYVIYRGEQAYPEYLINYLIQKPT